MAVYIGLFYPPPLSELEGKQHKQKDPSKNSNHILQMITCKKETITIGPLSLLSEKLYHVLQTITDSSVLSQFNLCSVFRTGTLDYCFILMAHILLTALRQWFIMWIFKILQNIFLLKFTVCSQNRNLQHPLETYCIPTTDISNQASTLNLSIPLAKHKIIPIHVQCSKTVACLQDYMSNTVKGFSV